MASPHRPHKENSKRQPTPGERNPGERSAALHEVPVATSFRQLYRLPFRWLVWSTGYLVSATSGEARNALLPSLGAASAVLRTGTSAVRHDSGGGGFEAAMDGLCQFRAVEGLFEEGLGVIG